MFKPARWRSEKNKIKVVFKLQFHATQLTQLVGDALMVSVVPADVGKPTARLEKAKVRDGSCYWEKPHYETVKFTQDPKTGKCHEKIYHFTVATGSSKFGGVGEVSIDLASYAEATKLSSVSLPLSNANSAAILHVSIQRVHGSFDKREVYESDNENSQGRSLRTELSNGDIQGNVGTNPTEDQETLIDNVNKVRWGSSGSDITLLSSDGSSGVDTPKEPQLENTKPTHESQWGWLDDSAPKSSTDESSISPRETLLNEISVEVSPDSEIKKLKSEITVLSRQVDVSELELLTLRKQIVKESKKGQDLLKEVATLKEERNAFKNECEKLKMYQKRSNEVKVKGDPWALLDEMRQELNYEKDLNSNLRLQLQKTQDSNAELILAVQDLDEMLEQKDLVKSKSKSSNAWQLNDDDEEQKALEEIVREHSGMQESYLLEQKIVDLCGQIESYKRDKDELEMQMEQIALDYEILKQENHEMAYKLQQSQLQEQLKMQYECSTSYHTVIELETQIESLGKELETNSKKLSASNIAINELETHVKNLEEELENQALGFEADLEDLMNAKVELEQRAIVAEENLRKIKLQTANSAAKLHQEFRRISMEMASTLEANETAAMKAMDEANQLRLEKRHLEETLKKIKEDLVYIRDYYEEKLIDLSNQINLKSNPLEKMEKQVENISNELEHQKSTCRAEIEKLKAEKQNLESQRKDLENELENSRNDLTELTAVKNDKDGEIKCLKSEMASLKSRCNDMKLSMAEVESEKDNKEATNLRDKIKLLEDQVKVKEIALDKSEKKFLEKEKDLQRKIDDLERRLEHFDQNTENSQIQVSTAENSSPMIISDDAILPESKHENKKDFDVLSKEMALLKNRNESMEVELKEMQERYSEISLKFAEVEGERQQLVMTLRNLKNAKKC